MLDSRCRENGDACARVPVRTKHTLCSLCCVVLCVARFWFAFVGILARTCNGIPMRFENICALFRKRVCIRFRNMLRYIFAGNVETMLSIAIAQSLPKPCRIMLYEHISKQNLRQIIAQTFPKKASNMFAQLIRNHSKFGFVAVSKTIRSTRNSIEVVGDTFATALLHSALSLAGSEL